MLGKTELAFNSCGSFLMESGTSLRRRFLLFFLVFVHGVGVVVAFLHSQSSQLMSSVVRGGLKVVPENISQCQRRAIEEWHAQSKETLLVPGSRQPSEGQQVERQQKKYTIRRRRNTSICLHTSTLRTTKRRSTNWTRGPRSAQRPFV